MSLLRVSLFGLIFWICPVSAWHDTEAPNSTIAVLGSVWTQMFVYEQQCSDHEHYALLMERLPLSPRFERYSVDLEHLSDRQELAWERGGVGAAAVIATGGTDCNTMAQVIWEWFGNN